MSNYQLGVLFMCLSIAGMVVILAPIVILGLKEKRLGHPVHSDYLEGPVSEECATNVNPCP